MANLGEFQGAGAPLDGEGFAAAFGAIGVGSAELWAVLSVETSGCGYLADRRPKVLFERHKFSHLTNHHYDASHPGVSQQTPGGYGPGGTHQYDRLAEAVALDREAALQSASWGIGQIMGSNYREAGFGCVEDMVRAMVQSESAQVRAMASFVKANALDEPLKTHNWAGFASGYNGADYAANDYDGKLEKFYQLYADADPPDLRVRAVQVYLTYRGISPGGIDGVAGKNTVSAIKRFQQSISVAPTGAIDDQLLAQLSAPP